MLHIVTYWVKNNTWNRLFEFISTQINYLSDITFRPTFDDSPLAMLQFLCFTKLKGQFFRNLKTISKSRIIWCPLWNCSTLTPRAQLPVFSKLTLLHTHAYMQCSVIVLINKILSEWTIHNHHVQNKMLYHCLKGEAGAYITKSIQI